MSEQSRVDQDVFNFICDYSDAERGRTPSMVEIMDGCGISSKGSLNRILARMEWRGWIRLRKPASANNIEIVFEPKAPRGDVVWENRWRKSNLRHMPKGFDQDPYLAMFG